MSCPDCAGPVRSYKLDDDTSWSQCLYCPWISRGGAEEEVASKLVVRDSDFDDLRVPDTSRRVGRHRRKPA